MTTSHWGGYRADRIVKQKIFITNNLLYKNVWIKKMFEREPRQKERKVAREVSPTAMLFRANRVEAFIIEMSALFCNSGKHFLSHQVGIS